MWYYYKITFTDGTERLSRHFPFASQCFKDLPFNWQYYREVIGGDINKDITQYYEMNEDAYVVYDCNSDSRLVSWVHTIIVHVACCFKIEEITIFQTNAKE